MKKIICIFCILVMCSLAVSAQQPQQTIKREPLQEHRSDIMGLDNAMLRVRNEEQKQHLEQVMNKIQNMNRERLQKMEQLRFEENVKGGVEAIGKVNGKFLGLLQMKKTLRYTVNENGEVALRKGFFDFLWKDVEEV